MSSPQSSPGDLTVNETLAVLSKLQMSHGEAQLVVEDFNEDGELVYYPVKALEMRDGRVVVSS